MSQNNFTDCRARTFKYVNSEINQRIYVVTAVMDLYFASIEFLETIAYFLDFQLIKDFSRNIQNPVRDLLVSM